MENDTGIVAPGTAEVGGPSGESDAGHGIDVAIVEEVVGGVGVIVPTCFG